MRRDNAAVEVQLRKLNLTNMEKDMRHDRKKTLVLRTKNNRKYTLKCHRKPAGIDCLLPLSTPHELK